MKSFLLLILISFIVADKYYTIQPGDTLSAIATKFGVTLSNLVNWNGIANPDLIYPETKIIIKKESSEEKDQPSPEEKRRISKITDSQMKQMGWENYNLEDLNKCINKFEINTIYRIRHFISQASYKSALGSITQDTADCKENKKKNKKFKDMIGDLCKYKGAGYIPLIGKPNYQEFANFMHDGKIMEGAQYVSEKYPWISAGFWWNKKKMNELCDKNPSVEDVSKEVKYNDKDNGLEQIKEYYEKACSIFK